MPWDYNPIISQEATIGREWSPPPEMMLDGVVTAFLLHESKPRKHIKLNCRGNLLLLESY